MLMDILRNAAILIALISIGHQLFRNEKITPSSSLKVRLIVGGLSGLLGILLMLNSVKIVPGLILDFRNIAIILAASGGGIVSAVLSGLLIGLFRLQYTGFDISSLVATTIAMSVSIVCGIIGQLVVDKKRSWTLMTLFGLIISTLGLALLIPARALLIKTLFAYWISIIVISYVTFLYINYLETINELYRRYKHDSHKDYLTGLNNVRRFDSEFNKIIRNLTDSSKISLLFIDIDYFKRVNDVYGHINGDRVLEDLGKVLLNSCRDTDVVARYGGEEFAVLLVDCPTSTAHEVAERIRETVETHSFSLDGGQSIHISVSIGIACYPETVLDINNLVGSADTALYQAKQAGRNTVILAS